METKKENKKYIKKFYLCNENGKPIHTSRQNLFSAIKEFLLYMSNEDIQEVEEHIEWVKKHRVKVVEEGLDYF